MRSLNKNIMEYEMKIVEGKAWRVCISADDLSMIGTFRCIGCGQTIKKQSHLNKHLETASHHKGTEWLARNRPDRQGKLSFLMKCQ